MVFGETTKTRLSARSSRKRYIGREEISETDEQHHLGIGHSVFTSTIHRTSERCTAASSFFALNSISSRLGCLHPMTSYWLYQTLCIPILLYGAEIWTLSKVEYSMSEQAHRNILHIIQGLPTSCHSSFLNYIIQGLPTSCHSSFLNYMLGSNNIELMIFQRELNTVNSIISLNNNSLPKKLLIKRTQDPLVKVIYKPHLTISICLASTSSWINPS